MEVAKQPSLSSIWEDSIEAVLQGFSVGFQQDGAPVAQLAYQYTLVLASLPSVSCFPHFFTPVPWDHFPSILPTSQP